MGFIDLNYFHFLTVCDSTTDLDFFFKNIFDFLGIPKKYTITFGVTAWRSYENGMSYCGLKAKHQDPLYRYFEKDIQVEHINWVERLLYILSPLSL